MADSAACASTTSSTDEQELKDIREIVWGPNIRLDVFRRWSQGLQTSVQFSPKIRRLIPVCWNVRSHFA